MVDAVVPFFRANSYVWEIILNEDEKSPWKFGPISFKRTNTFDSSVYCYYFFFREEMETKRKVGLSFYCGDATGKIYMVLGTQDFDRNGSLHK